MVLPPFFPRDLCREQISAGVYRVVQGSDEPGQPIASAVKRRLVGFQTPRVQSTIFVYRID